MEQQRRRGRTFLHRRDDGRVRVTVFCSSTIKPKNYIRQMKRYSRRKAQEWAKELLAGQISADSFQAKIKDQLKSTILAATHHQDNDDSENEEIVARTIDRFDVHMAGGGQTALDAITAAIQIGALSPESESFDARIGGVVSF